MESRDLVGTSSLFISTDQKNPGPFDYEVTAGPGDANKLLKVDRGGETGPIYIGIQGATADSIVSLVSGGELCCDFIRLR